MKNGEWRVAKEGSTKTSAGSWPASLRTWLGLGLAAGPFSVDRFDARDVDGVTVREALVHVVAVGLKADHNLGAADHHHLRMANVIRTAVGDEDADRPERLLAQVSYDIVGSHCALIILSPRQ